MKSKVKIQPLGSRVLVEAVKEEKQVKGGIIIPDTAKEKPQEGKVIALGTGKLDDDGKKVDWNVKKGDRILMPQYGGTVVKIEEIEYQIMREDDILGVIN
jgi:chaperonin GroES